MDTNATCGELLFTWVLIASMILLYNKFGDVGLIVAIVPMSIAQKIRFEHDRLIMTRFVVDLSPSA